MNFKRNLFVITTALVGALALAGCDFGENKFKHFEFIEEKQDTKEDYLNFMVKDNATGEDKDLGNAYSLMRDYAGQSHMKSIGEQKMIVVPVEFPDYKVEKLSLTNEQYIEGINKAFFGNAKNNAYVSVGEYFNKSSYGKLKLDGKVCDQVFTFPYSIEKIKESKLERDVLANDIYKKVIDWYKENYDDIADYEVEGLKTGKNVPIYMIYTHPSISDSKEDETGFFWAYTFSDVPLSWSSASFMYLQYGEPDAHTYIHETGHLLGLSDYYPTIIPEESKTKTKAGEKEVEEEEEKEPYVAYEPTARIDMMDCSIGDETSFSKMLLNWAKPTYVNSSQDVTIRSFTETGDVVLLSNNWNHTPFDEYYLFEYYSPTGLNSYDISVGNSEAKLPKLPGIKIYHVDARLAYFESKTIKSYCVFGEKAPGSTFTLGFAHDNNTYINPDDYQKNYLYTLILNHEEGMKTGAAVDSNLFRYGDEIPDLKINSGEKLNYKISVSWSGFEEVGIKFEKVEKTTK
ncbi:MAG: hypothetical protein MJ222_02390 [Bacilli bacterium]|nr:hypothetical protein [Bacilli bacterium]